MGCAGKTAMGDPIGPPTLFLVRYRFALRGRRAAT